MSQPKTKARIIERLKTERRRLEANLEALTPGDMLEPGVVGPWSVKDILAHLADWEAHMPLWMAAARRGETVDSPEAGFTWQQLDLFNARIYERHRDRSLEDVLAYFRETHRQFMEMVEAMSEEEMVAPSRYAFTGKGAIWDWLSAFAAHDLWAKTHLRQWIRERA